MRWELEELTEDAIVDYLKVNCDETINVQSAWGWVGDLNLPAAVVHAGTTEPISEDAAWHDPRMIAVAVSIKTGRTPVTDDLGNTIQTVREQNIEARTKVLNLLAVSNLATLLNARGIDNVAFSMAQLVNTERDIVEDGLVTVAHLEVIAEPVTGS